MEISTRLVLLTLVVSVGICQAYIYKNREEDQAVGRDHGLFLRLQTGCRDCAGKYVSPGESYSDGCNVCKCGLDGKPSACTRMYCPCLPHCTC